MNEEVNKQTETENTAQERTLIDADGFKHSVTYDDKGRVAADKRYDKNGALLSQNVYENGVQTHRYEYDESAKVCQDTVFEYDGNGRQTAERVFLSDGEVSRTEFEYDDRGLLLGKVRKDRVEGSGDSLAISLAETYRYDDNRVLRYFEQHVGASVDSISFDENGAKRQSTSYVYGELKKQEFCTEQGDYTFNYGSDGRLISESFVSPDKRTVSTLYEGGADTQHIDEDGNELSITYVNDDGKLYPSSVNGEPQGKFAPPSWTKRLFGGKEKTAEEVIDKLAYKDEWLLSTFNDRMSGRMTVDERIKDLELSARQYQLPWEESDEDEIVIAPVNTLEENTIENGDPQQTVENVIENGEPERTVENMIENGDPEQTVENVIVNAAPEQTAENSDNQSDQTSENEDEEVYVAENGNEDEKAKGLGEEDLMKQGKNLQQWINYFGMEGSRAKPPYASPFESIKECRNLKGSALMDLENGNTLINSTNRMELVVRSKEGEKKEPTLEECMTLVRLGQQKGWTSIRITGSPAFQKQMYLACRSLGMPTKDFVPTPEMLKEGAELENAFNSKDKTLPQSAEDTEARNPEMREPTLSERCADLDSRFFALEKIREIQPSRKKTKEDPHPELANFDTIRAAEKEGIRPLTAVEKEPDDLDGKLRVLNKRSKEALEDLKQTEKNRKRALLNEMGADQRNEWRNRLTAVQQKEDSGQPLSAEDNRIKAMADKYQINVDPTKEPETRRRIDLEDFDQKNKKAFRKKESMIERTSAFETAVVRREAALNASAMISSESAKLPSKKDLLATARKEWKQIASAHQPVSETLRQIGNINAETATLTERNKKNYNKVTKRNEKNNQQASEASEQRNAFVHAAAQNSR